jgi:hypothetical protein
MDGISVDVFISYCHSDPPPLKWSDLRYVFDIKEDRNGKETGGSNLLGSRMGVKSE